MRLNKSNNGKNGGRSCWVIAGTLCGGEVQGVFAQKVQNCMTCDFYKIVMTEEKALGAFEQPQQLLKKIK